VHLVDFIIRPETKEHFGKKFTLTIGDRSQQIADTHVTVIRIQGVSFYTQQKMAVLCVSAAPIKKTLQKVTDILDSTTDFN